MAINRNDSPTARKPAAQFSILDEESFVGSPVPSEGSSMTSSSASHGIKRSNDSAKNSSPIPLAASKMVNHQSPIGTRASAPKKITTQPGMSVYDENQSAIDKLLSHLIQPPQESAARPQVSNTKSSPIVIEKADMPGLPPAKKFTTDTSPAKKEEATKEIDEVTRLRLELEAAKNMIAAMNEEKTQQRTVVKQIVNRALTSPSEISLQLDGPEPWMAGVPSGFNYPLSAGSREDNLSDSGIAMMPNTFEKYQGPWLEDSPGLMPLLSAPVSLANQQSAQMPGWNGPSAPSMSNIEGRFGAASSSRLTGHGFQAPWQNNLRLDTSDNMQAYRMPMTNSPPDQAFLRPSLPSTRPGSAFGGYPYSGGGMNAYPTSASSAPGYSPPMTPLGFQQPVSMQHSNSNYHPRPIGTPLSPTALEFDGGVMLGNNQQQPWNAQSSSEATSGYVPPMEPLNYRRLLDRNMNCNWKYIVDKIVCSNDQQASIFLQQKLKVSSPEQKFELVEAIIAQAYPLMINRFGNFLVQRCFEHGTQEQIIAIANAIRGNTLPLSMDPFGCHVVQKAFDVVPEDYKAIMVHELLRRIPETVIHRYACHVWQKLFELRWSDSPPQIMKYVNEALRGMWHEVALGETGSLVVQNIFENCLEEDKRPCINEVLASIDIVSHGQFGNWCIQHICEHGGSADKSRAVEHVLRFATEYSTDQFASKVVEKCLKVAGTDFLDRYLERVCEGRADRPRMPLIDIAGDQYGNYLIQYILIHADPQRREIVATHIRKHMVSLRGSKFGSRVAMLCCNPASATRPGPPMAMAMNNRYMQQQPSMPMQPAPGPAYGRPGMPGLYR